MKCNIPDRVLTDISRSALKYGVNKVVLFGSRARGTHTERSDIDIAVYGGDFDKFFYLSGWKSGSNGMKCRKHALI